MADVDLSGVGIVDAHTHPYRLEDLRRKGSEGFDTRAMFLGESFLSSSQMHAELWPVADAFTDSTVYALALRRWLAATPRVRADARGGHRRAGRRRSRPMRSRTRRG